MVTTDRRITSTPVRLSFVSGGLSARAGIGLVLVAGWILRSASHFMMSPRVAGTYPDVDQPIHDGW